MLKSRELPKVLEVCFVAIKFLDFDFFFPLNPVQDILQPYKVNFCFYAVLRAQLRKRSAAVMALAIDSFSLRHIPFSLPASLGSCPKPTTSCLYCVLLCFSLPEDPVLLSPHTMSHSLQQLLYSPFLRLSCENCVTSLCAEHI